VPEHKSLAAEMLTRHLTVSEVAERERVKPDTVRGWIRSGELPAIDLARRGAKRPRFRIRLEDLQAFERGRCAGSPTPQPAPRRKAAKTSGKVWF
jgi:excisionase family DNA binding protein